MLKFLRWSALIPVVLICIAGLALLLTAPKEPPPIAAIQNASPAMRGFAEQQPSAQAMTARDGTGLSYRYYPGETGRGIVVAVHGSSGTSSAMHGVAQALSQQGIGVYAIDLRGHGRSKGPEGKLGDVAYRGQYEDDFADIAKFVGDRHAGERRLLLGHSMGAAVVMRTASLPDRAKAYDAYLALSPFIAPGGPMDRPNQGGWTSVSVPRIVVLSILNGFGISALDHMPVLAMAVPPNDDGRPRSYSHALLASANLPRDWKPSVAAITAPTRILIGAKDELFVAQAYPTEIGSANSAIPVKLLPGVTHMSMVTDPRALEDITRAAAAMLQAGG